MRLSIDVIGIESDEAKKRNELVMDILGSIISDYFEEMIDSRRCLIVNSVEDIAQKIEVALSYANQTKEKLEDIDKHQEILASEVK